MFSYVCWRFQTRERQQIKTAHKQQDTPFKTLLNSSRYSPCEDIRLLALGEATLIRFTSPTLSLQKTGDH